MTPQDKQWFEEQFSTLSDKIEATETKLLTAFYKWASPTDIKLRSNETDIAALKERLSLIEERVRDIESGRSKPH